MGPDWVMLSVVSVLGLAVVILGIMGYSAAGIPFSGSTRLTGAPGKTVGTFSIALGLALIWWAGRIFGPKASDGFAYAFVRALPLGVAIYTVARVGWLLRTGSRYGRPTCPLAEARPLRASRTTDGFITCPHCGKRMVDTEQEKCRFCAEDLRNG
jgi:hypothetical protein